MSITKELIYNVISISNKNISASVKLKTIDDEKQQMYTIHRALKQQIYNKRNRKVNTKTRSEVRGGGRKPWKQKGTGRARAGSNRSPLWKGGGVIFGPKNKIYNSKINKKENRLAINTIIANKFSHTTIINDFLSDTRIPNTKQALSELNQLGIKINSKAQILFLVDNKTKVLNLSLKNIKQIEIMEASSTNILSLLKADKIILTLKALKILQGLNN